MSPAWETPKSAVLAQGTWLSSGAHFVPPLLRGQTRHTPTVPLVYGCALVPGTWRFPLSASGGGAGSGGQPTLQQLCCPGTPAGSRATPSQLMSCACQAQAGHSCRSCQRVRPEAGSWGWLQKRPRVCPRPLQKPCWPWHLAHMATVELKRGRCPQGCAQRLLCPLPTGKALRPLPCLLWPKSGS